MRVPVGQTLPLVLWAFFSIALTPVRADAQTSSLIDLGTLGGSFSDAVAINDKGQAVGFSATTSGELHGFLWQHGVMTDLGTLGGAFSEATAINTAGQVVGQSRTESGSSPIIHGFLWENGVMTDLGTLGGRDSVAVGINASGQVVGRSVAADGQLHGFLWQDGVMTDLGTMGGSFSAAVGLNEGGQVVGVSETANFELHGFLWQDGVMTDLGTLGGGFTDAVAINNKGQVVGQSRTASGEDHAFLWQNGVMTDLGTLGGSFSDAAAINDAGHILGRSATANNDQHAFLFRLATDTTPPMTSAAPSPGPNANGWYKTDVTVTLSSVDNEGGSGVNEIVYSAMGTQATVGTTVPGSSASIIFTDEGTTTLTYFARDNAGNAEAPHSLVIQIDRTAPAISVEQSPPANSAGWNNMDVTNTYSCTDALSGMASCPPAQSFTAEGQHPVMVTAMDLAENTATLTLTVNIDKTAPILNVPANITENATNPSGATVTYSNLVSTTDNLDTNPIISCNPPSGSTLPIGISTVTCTATDAADNTVSGTFQITVKGASEQIVDLIVKVAKIFNHDSRITGTLKSSLQRALDAHIARSTNAVCMSLTAFVKGVQAQAGKKITVAQADELIADANRIRTVLNCRGDLLGSNIRVRPYRKD